MPTRAEIESAWKIRVTQKHPSDRNSLCGVHYKLDEKGRKYFDIPAWCKVDAVVLGYEIGEEFNPYMSAPADVVTAPNIGALLEASPAPVAQEIPKIEKPRRGPVKRKGRKPITIKKTVTAPAPAETPAEG